MWTLLSDAGAKVWLYDFLYYWHVPAFVIVTGYLSRNFDYSHDRLRALFRTVVVPYMVFELVLALFRVYVGHEDINDIWADPHWPMWYLAALFFWRLFTPLFRRRRTPPSRSRSSSAWSRASAPPTGSTSLACWACCRSS